MDMYEVISELVTAPGVTGNEGCAADVAEKYFRRFSDNVWRDCRETYLHAWAIKSRS